MNPMALLNVFLALGFSPLLFGVINRTKAIFAGRKGQPILQLYYDLGKLLQKGAVYSRTTTWVFRSGPLVSLVALFLAAWLVPSGGAGALFSFNGDLVLFIYLLGLVRFFTVLAALDTGSSFEGMGASREVQFALLAEPALFLGLAVLARQMGEISLSGIYSHLTVETWKTAGPILALVAGTILIVFLAENARIPVDDPNTHLELTMIHEVMALDHGGVDLGFILYGAALKFWLLGTLLVGLILPVRTGNLGLDTVVFFVGMVLLSIVVGSIESVMARLRLLKVQHLLVAALSLSVLALVFQVR
jgi:formate hydrogenlyase subunit 4